MTAKSLRRLKPFIYLILFFFCWTNLGIYNIAYAATNDSGQGSVAGGQQNSKTTDEKFQEALERLKDGVDKEDVNKIKAERGEIEKHDVEIKKQFKETEAKIKDLPDVIKQRHKDFVKKYEENLNTLNSNLDGIEKAKTTAEKQQALQKAKEFLEKTKAKSQHKPYKPSESPNRLREFKPVKTSWLQQLGGFIIPSAYAAEPQPPGASDLADTIETPLNQEIRDLAANLGGTPVNLYEYVRNAFKYEPYEGSVKGAIQTLKERGGNEWDLASLLIAFYRANGIPARYVVGTIELPIDKAKSWLGLEDANMAASLLFTQGRPTTLVISGGKISAIHTQHVWVQAYVPFLSSRGATSGTGDTWIDLDPSFKPQTSSQTLSLITGIPSFDQSSYLSTLRTESPLDYYRNQIQSFLNNNAPGYTPDAIARKLEISQEWLGVLIGQVPYTVKSIIGTYSEVPDSYRQKFTVSITNPYTGEADLSYAAPLPSIIGKRLTLSYVPATAADEATIAVYGDIFSTPPYLIKLKPVIKLDGTSVAEGNAVGSGEEQSLQFIFDTTIDTGIVENIVIAGGYYAIGLNAQTGSGSHQEVLDRSKKLASITDTIKLNDLSTLDDRLGELLHLSALVYHQNLNMAIRKLAPLHKVGDIREVSEMMYFLAVKVDYLFGVPRKITPTGITADMDRDIHLIIPVDGDMGRIKPYMQVESTHGSYLEHAVTEKVYQTEALSSVKAIQLAHDQGIQVYTITSQNIATVLPLLQVSDEIKSDISNAVNAGQEVIVPERNITLGDWTGVGYIIQDPDKGNGAYLISGGYGGAATIHQAYLYDRLTEPMYAWGAQVRSCANRQTICYPGQDNSFGTSDDTCYTEIAMEDIDPVELRNCESATPPDPGCRNKYAPSHSEVARPLIDIQEQGINGGDRYLTKNIQAKHWQSQDGARYMRAGFAVLMTVEALMKSFAAQKHGINDNGSGYRTQNRNRYLQEQGNRRPSNTSHHMDGVATDIVLSDFQMSINQPPSIKCQIMKQANDFVSGKGAVKDEGTERSVHISIPTMETNDVWRNCR